MRSKKRKRALAQTKVSATGDDQGVSLGSGEDAADRITLIPDTVLGEIVSLLPTKEGAHTQVLVSRWRHIWRSAPLNLDCSGLAMPINPDCGGEPTKKPNHNDVVSHILAFHQAPVRRICILAGHGCMESWLSFPTLDNLQELEFGYLPRWDYGVKTLRYCWKPLFLPPPPASTFCFVATLRLANIGKCHLLDNIVQGFHFPQLKHLALIWVHISECSIHRLIARRPALDYLLIEYIFGFQCLRINSLTLRSIGVRKYFLDKWSHEKLLEKLIIESAPCLERFLRLDLFDGLQLSVISAPKFKTLGFVNNHHASYSKIIKRLHANTLTPAARSVKTLAIHMCFLDLDIVIDLITCFPCLDKLYIHDEYVLKPAPKNLWRRKHRKLIGSLDIHLKTIVLETYRGTMSHVNFTAFFVLNARELELMTIQVATIDEQFIAKQEIKVASS